MSELRDLVIDAHGGKKRWDEISSLDIDMSGTGLLWGMKGWHDVLKDVGVEIDTKKQMVRYRRFTDPRESCIYRPDHAAIETLEGLTLEERSDPRASFQDHTVQTKWDKLDLAYFSGYAIWNYLNAPFFFLLPGVETAEIEPWDEQGERRRRLRVRFPTSVATHCPEQTFHINDEGLIGRLDYRVSITAGLPMAHYLSEYEDFGGIKIATKRRSYRQNPDGSASPEPLIVGLDITAVRVQ